MQLHVPTLFLKQLSVQIAALTLDDVDGQCETKWGMLIDVS